MSIPSVTLSAQANSLQFDAAASNKESRVQAVASDKPADLDNKLAGANKAQDKLAPENKFSPEELQKAADKVNTVVNLYASELKFTVDDKEGVVVKVINTDTKEVIRQIPSEEMLKIAQSIDQLRGLLVHQKA